MVTPDQIKERLRIELARYGLQYRDNSDSGVERFSIVKPGETLLGFEIKKPDEVARVTSFGSKLEIMVFDRSQVSHIKDVAEAIKENLKKEYRILKGY